MAYGSMIFDPEVASLIRVSQCPFRLRKSEQLRAGMRLLRIILTKLPGIRIGQSNLFENTLCEAILVT